MYKLYKLIETQSISLIYIPEMVLNRGRNDKYFDILPSLNQFAHSKKRIADDGLFYIIFYDLMENLSTCKISIYYIIIHVT